MSDKNKKRVLFTKPTTTATAPVPPRKMSKGEAKKLVACRKIDALVPTDVGFECTGTLYDSGTLWIKPGATLTLENVTISRRGEDSRGKQTVGIRCDPDCVALAKCRDVDTEIDSVVTTLGGVPPGAKHVKLASDQNWINIKFATCKDHVGEGDTGTFTLALQGIYRLSDPNGGFTGYGLTYKVVSFIKTEEEDTETPSDGATLGILAQSSETFQ